MKLTDRELEILDNVFGAAYSGMEEDYKAAKTNLALNAIEAVRKEMSELYDKLVEDDNG